MRKRWDAKETRYIIKIPLIFVVFSPCFTEGIYIIYTDYTWTELDIKYLLLLAPRYACMLWTQKKSLKWKSAYKKN